MTAHPAPADPVNPTDASAENRGLTPKARQALEGLPPALAALGHVELGAALILAGTGAMLAAAVVLALACSLGMSLPISTPPNAIAFGSGYVTIGQMIKGGIGLNLIALVLITATTMTLGVWVFNLAF